MTGNVDWEARAKDDAYTLSLAEQHIRQLEARAEDAEAREAKLRERIEAVAGSLRCHDRHDDAGEQVCGTHGFLWPKGQQWCNGVTTLEADVLALAAEPTPDTEPGAEDGARGRTLGCMWCDEDSCDHGASKADPRTGGA